MVVVHMACVHGLVARGPSPSAKGQGFETQARAICFSLSFLSLLEIAGCDGNHQLTAHSTFFHTFFGGVSCSGDAETHTKTIFSPKNSSH